MNPAIVIESRTRNRATHEVLITGTQSGQPFTVRIDGKLVDLAVDPEYYLTSCVERALDEAKR